MKKISIVFLLVFGLLSCSKLMPKSNFFGEWVVIKKEQLTSENTWVDITQPCDKDDAEAYRNMGLWYYYPGELRCDPSEDIMQGTWNYDKDDNRLIYANTANINVSEAYVDLITKDSMTLSMNQGDSITIRIKYAKAK